MAMWRWLSPTRAGWSWGIYGWVDVRKLLLDRMSRSRRDLPNPKLTAPEEVLLAITVVRDVQSHLEAELAALVAEARARDVSWDEIAAALGTRRQSAHQRYSRITESWQLSAALSDHVHLALSLASEVAVSGRDTFLVSVREAKRLQREQGEIDAAAPGGRGFYLTERNRGLDRLRAFDEWPYLGQRTRRTTRFRGEQSHRQ